MPTFNGGPDTDTLTGTAGSDVLNGLDGNDFLEGGDGDDQLNGGAGADTVVYSRATSGVTVSVSAGFTVKGFFFPVAQDTGQGRDTLADIENIVGSAFNDRLTGDAGANVLVGGAGDDILDGGFGMHSDDVLDGGEGVDWVRYDTAQAGVTVSLAIVGPQNTGFGGIDTLSNFENLGGTRFDDFLTGDRFDNILDGGLGADRLDGGGGNDTVTYATAPGSVSVNLSTSAPQDTVASFTDTLISIENLIGSASDDTLVGSRAANVLDGGGGDDILAGGIGDDILKGGAGADTLIGGDGSDTAVFSGLRSSYVVTLTATGATVVGADGADTVAGIEFLRFDDQTLTLATPAGRAINFGAPPATYMAPIRDFDGNDLGASGDWVRIGQADLQGDGAPEQIFTNRTNGRWASVGTAPDGLVYFDDHGWGGDTRVVGIYVDPLIRLGRVVAGGPFDSQARLQSDLFHGNINGVLGAADYDHDGYQEVYFSLGDGTAYLHAYMHADGNIRYANYQTQQQVIDYLTGNGWAPITWAGWFA